MGVWRVVFLVALAGFGISADSSARFPEEARGPSRIVSGWEAELGQIPHQLSIRIVNPTGGVTSCGASIIHSEWGITAAHCTAQRITIVIRAGTVNLTRPEILFETTEYYNHPNYIDAIASIVQPDDISLLKFGRAITFSANVQPIRLQPSADKDKNYDGFRLVASGWGRTWTQGTSPENLNWVFLLGESNENCLQAYGFSPIIQDTTICASGYNVSSQSTCQGDSGGPLSIVDVDGTLTLVGVTSFVSASGCHTPVPAGFVRPGYYHDWIFEVTGIDFNWDPSAITTTAAPETTTEEPSEESSEEDSSESSSEESSSEEESEEETTTEAPEETTEAPVTTEKPETTTEAPEETTTEAPVTTEKPETTTEAPEETTTEAPVTTEKPETTTEAPEETTTEAPVTTEKPETTTEAPEETTTEAPVTTEKPETTTESATEAPEETTTEATVTTEKAETTTVAVTETTTEEPVEEDTMFNQLRRFLFLSARQH